MGAANAIIGGVERGLNALESNQSGIIDRLFNGARKEISSWGSVGESLTNATVRPKLDLQDAYLTTREAMADTMKGLDEHITSAQGTLETMQKSGYQNEGSIKQQQLLQQKIAGIQSERQRLAESISAGDQSGSYNYAYKEAPGMWDKAKNLGGQIKDYYTEGSTRDLATRAGVTAGVYAAGAIGGRYLSGGTLTTNNQGESDIAGIPFI